MIFMLYIFLYLLLHIYNKLHIFKYFQPFTQRQEKWPLHLKGLLPWCCERVPRWDAPVPSAWCTWTANALSPSSTKAVLSWLSKCKALNFSPELSKFGKLEDSTDSLKEDALDCSVNAKGQADLWERFGEALLSSFSAHLKKMLFFLFVGGHYAPCIFGRLLCEWQYREYLLKSAVGGPEARALFRFLERTLLCFCGACF